MAVSTIKCLLVGDSIGKTPLVKKYLKLPDPLTIIPTVFDTFTTNYRYDGHTIKLDLFDTAGAEEYDRLRPLSYPQTDVVVMCFALDSLNSHEQIEKKWCPEIKQHCPSSPIILVGTRLDLRNDIIEREGENSKKIITTNQGLTLQKKIGARKYVECSAYTGERVQRVFDEAVRAVIEPDPATF